ncbi:unnamed protein product, partial [Ixodes persulcatus]
MACSFAIKDIYYSLPHNELLVCIRDSPRTKKKDRSSQNSGPKQECLPEPRKFSSRSRENSPGNWRLISLWTSVHLKKRTAPKTDEPRHVLPPRTFQEVLEDQKGVRGYHALHGALQSASGQKASLDDRKNATLEDMAAMVTNLNSRITDKKGRLAPIIKDLRPLRKSCQDLTIEYEKKKSTYDSCAAGLESNLSRLEQEVTSLRNELNAQESKSHFLQLSLQIHDAQLKFLEANGALEPGILQGDGSAKKLSLRDRLNQEISEQEKEGKALRERQKQVREGQEALRNQALMWKHLERLLRSKTSSGAQRE